MLENALKKLESQFNAEKDPVRKQFAKPVLEYMKKRCQEDEGLCRDVLQEHKTWNDCYSYITATARKHIKGNAGAVLDQTVYEWAEDYFRKDDKAEAEERKKKEEEKKAKLKAKKSQKASGKTDEEKKKPNTSKSKESTSNDSEGSQPAPVKEKKAKAKPKKNEADGQMSIFDFLGGGA